jgi:hypothetical protein
VTLRVPFLPDMICSIRQEGKRQGGLSNPTITAKMTIERQQNSAGSQTAPFRDVVARTEWGCIDRLSWHD